MAKYHGTHVCGHEGIACVIGPIKDRQWKIDKYFERKCPDCEQQEREQKIKKENYEARKKSEEMELPQLTGTEKQIAWANTLRLQFVELETMYSSIKQEISWYLYENNMDASIVSNVKDDMIFLVKDKIISEQKTSSFWINHRCDIKKEFIKQIISYATRVYIPEEVIKETIIEPESVNHLGYVEIIADEDKVSAKYEKDYDFINIVRSLGYKWSGTVWERCITSTSGSSFDRAAELGNKLLIYGFRVMIQDQDIRNAAINATFETETDRWIIAPNNYDKYVQAICNDDRDLTSKLLHITHSRLKQGRLLLPLSSYEEIEEVCEIHKFKVTKKAQQRIDTYKANEESAEIARITIQKEHTKSSYLEDILKSGDDVLYDLKD